MADAKKPAKETHQSIARQVAEFLKAGHEIQRIPNGVSGSQAGFSPYKKSKAS